MEPTAAERKGGMGPFIAAFVVALVFVAAVIFWPRDKHTIPDATNCPKTFPAATPLWVPAKADTANPGKKLVPDGLPDKAVVCGYVAATGASDTQPVALTGSKKLVGDPRAVVEALQHVAAPGRALNCPAYRASTDADHYLLALSYTGKVVWVSIPGNHCAGSSNGVYTSPTNLRLDATQALQNGMWPTDPSLTTSCNGKPSPSASTTLAAYADASVSVCLQKPDGLTHVYRFKASTTHLTSGYNRAAAQYLATAAPRSTCMPGTDLTNDQPFVAHVEQSGGDAVLRGSNSCIAGPGNVYLTGQAAHTVDRFFTTYALATL